MFVLFIVGAVVLFLYGRSQSASVAAAPTSIKTTQILARPKSTLRRGGHGRGNVVNGPSLADFGNQAPTFLPKVGGRFKVQPPVIVYSSDAGGGGGGTGSGGGGYSGGGGGGTTGGFGGARKA